MSISLDQDALANLTPEERAAFDEPEYSAAELAAMQKLADKAADDDGDPDEVLDANGVPVVTQEAADQAAAVVASAAKADDAGASAAAVETATPAAQAPAQSTYKAELPQDYADKVKDLSERTATLRANFKAGEMEFDDYEAQLATLAEEKEGLTMARAKAEISQEMTQQQTEQQWKTAINTLYDSAAKDSGIDYRKDPDRNAELDQFVKVLANNPANADKSMDWFLSEGHKRVLVLNGQALKAADVPNVKDGGKPNAQVRTPPVVPKHLAQVPGGDGPGDVGSEFAQLDALDGNDLEAAIAKMSPAQREKYSRGG